MFEAPYDETHSHCRGTIQRGPFAGRGGKSAEELAAQASYGHSYNDPGIVSLLKDSRSPPALAATFADELRAKTFTNGSDASTVNVLFSSVASAVFQGVRALQVNYLNWGPAELEVLLRVLPQCEGLVDLQLGGNPLGDTGLTQLAAFARVGGLRSLTALAVEQTEAGDEGLCALADAMLEGHLPKLHKCWAWGNPRLTPRSVGKLREAFNSGAMPEIGFIQFNSGDRVFQLGDETDEEDEYS